MSDYDFDEYEDDHEDSGSEGSVDYGSDTEPEMRAERAAGDRTNVQKTDLEIVADALKKGQDLSTISNIMWRRALSDVDKFSVIVQAYYDHYSEVLTTCRLPSWRQLQDIIGRVDKVRYRNPLAFFLGVCIVHAKTTQVQCLIQIRSSVLVNDQNVTPEDAFRYSRYVKTLQ